MKKYWLRSSLFNLAFYGFTFMACIVALPTYFLPRKAFLWVVRTYLAVNTGLERSILGLSYEVRGLENLPAQGSFIVAAKHQSPYETFKLHVLFEDPAVILKKELLSIPIWGGFLKKTDVIAIDRSSREQAMSSIVDGSLRMKEQGRPIIIFPQGTRVAPDETTKEKPFKFGVARVYEATGLPVIPLALNAGYFYPKKSWCKRPGRVVFEFLPPIETGMTREKLMTTLEGALEEKSLELLQDARHIDMTRKSKSGLIWRIFGLFLVIALTAGYAFLWFKTAELIQKNYAEFKVQGGERLSSGSLTITGFPGPLQITGGEEFIQTPEFSAKIDSFNASGFPIPFLPFTLKTGHITLSSFQHESPLDIDSALVTIRLSGMNTITIDDGLVTIGTFTAIPKGTISYTPEREPEINLNVALQNHESLIQTLLEKRLVEERSALFVNAGLSALSTNGIVTVPLRLMERTVYVGPFAVLTLPESNPARFSPAPATDILPAPAP